MDYLSAHSGPIDAATDCGSIASAGRLSRQVGTHSGVATEQEMASGWRIRRLWMYGVGMLVPLTYFAVRYPLREHSNILVDIGQLAQYKRGEYLGYVGGIVLLFALYILALAESRHVSPRQALPAIFGCGTALAAAMACMYPVSAVDVFTYAVRSRLVTTYHANPMVALFKNHPHDPWVHFVQGQWAAAPSPYGPVWNLIAAPITRVAGDNMLVALVGFKLLSLVCLLIAGWAIARCCAEGKTVSPATGALFYLWNPLVLWEGVGNAHNDVVMMVPLLLALVAWHKRRDHLVVPLLVVAALIKYVPVLLIPLAAIALWRRTTNWKARWSLIGWSVGLSLLALNIALYPFYDLKGILTSMAAQSRIFRMSPAAMFFELLIRYYPSSLAGRWLRTGGESVVAATLAGLAIALWRRRVSLERASFEILFVFLFAATWYFNGWYLIWLVALAALLPLGWPAWRISAWSAGAMATYALSIWIQSWWHFGFVGLHNIGVPLTFGCALLLTLAELVWWTVRRQPAAVEPSAVGYEGRAADRSSNALQSSESR